MSAQKVEKELRAALEARMVVSLRRDLIEPAPARLDGFVVGLGGQLVVLHRVSERIDLDGWEIVRSGDITSVACDEPRRRFLEAAARVKHFEPKSPGILDLASIRSATASAQELHGFVVIEQELEFPEECQIGRVTVSTESELVLRTISPTAEWNDGRVRIPISQITRISFGGEYERTLALVHSELAELD